MTQMSSDECRYKIWRGLPARRLPVLMVAAAVVSGVMAYSVPERSTPVAAVVVNGVPWYDRRDSIVSAHGANIISDDGRYYMFGEFKTDSANVFKGFSCYSSPDLANWNFEGMALEPQPEGILGPGRVGERPKVLRCPSTGEYVMVMHSDNMRYKDPCVAYATSPHVAGPYTFRGPLLYKGRPIRKWDIGTFADSDGNAYLLVHHGSIFRFAPDCHSLDSCMSDKVAGVGESPAMIRRGGRYYWFSSQTTSWERNDNMYVSSESLSGPWEKHGNFAPVGSNTWNSQTSFVLPVVNGADTTFVFMGDRWSFPKQRSAATYFWQPLQWTDGAPSLPEYWESWDASTFRPVRTACSPLVSLPWTGTIPGEACSHVISLGGDGRIYIKGPTDADGAYAEVEKRDGEGNLCVRTPVDFYSLAPADGLRYISPVLGEGRYKVTVRVSDMSPVWTDKKRNRFGSKGHKVQLSEIGHIPYSHMNIE